MEQTRFPVYKSKPMKPLLYSCLTTSTPDSHQVVKRIKRSLGYSEHFKGNRVDYPIVGSRFSPLKTRDYRKARELTLEIWDPMVQADFLERFLKSQRNIHTIQINVPTGREYKGKVLKQLCEILSTMSRLNRVHINFVFGEVEQVKLYLLNEIRWMRLLPRLNDLNVTVDGKHVLPFSVSLVKVGFGGKSGSLEVETAPNLPRVIEKTLKFNQLDTIIIDTKKIQLEEKFLDSVSLVISKLPNFRELDLNSSKDSEDFLTCNFLDVLAAKAPKIEILKLAFPTKEEDQISFLMHDLFKIKSLKRTSLSFRFQRDKITSEGFGQIFDLLGEIPSLHGLSMCFNRDIEITDEIAEDHMGKISRMTSLRKLRIHLKTGMLSEKHAGNIFTSIFDHMPLLEELELHLPQNCLGISARDIRGLPRLKKASLDFNRDQCKKVDDMQTIVEVLGKCHQLRELELDLHAGGYDNYEEVMTKLNETLRKLRRLEVFKLVTSEGSEVSNLTMDPVEEMVRVWDQLRNLQDFNVRIYGVDLQKENCKELQRYLKLAGQVTENKKYRRKFFVCT